MHQSTRHRPSLKGHAANIYHGAALIPVKGHHIGCGHAAHESSGDYIPVLLAIKFSGSL
jgi:hypothetical protein